MQLWGVITKVTNRKTWAVTGIWQGQRRFFSQVPTFNSFLPCISQEMAEFLQLEISREIERGIFRPERYNPQRPLSLQHYANEWLKSIKSRVTFVTWRGYSGHLNNHILPALGKEYLADIGSEKLDQFLDSLTVAPKTRKNIMGCLHKLFKDAIRHGYINQLPVWPEFTGERSIPQQKIQWINQETQELILRYIPLRHRPIFAFMMATGVRPSEARALRKRDIKEDHIVVAVTFAAAPDGGQHLKPVKNRREEAIPLYDSVRDILASLPRSLSEFVFVNPDTNKPYSAHFNDIWNPACKAALGYVVPLNKACRHSFANQLLAAGVDLELVSAMLRHSDTAITKTNYGKPHLQIMKKAADNVRKWP